MLICITVCVTSESQRDITCDSLGDVTWSHGTHDVRDLSGWSDRSRMRKPHQGGQNCIVIAVHIYERGFYYGGFE